MPDVRATLRRYKPILDLRLEALFETWIDEAEADLKPAYSYLRAYVLNGGKRLRPILTVMAYKAVRGGDDDGILGPAAGIELFHSSSLIHDDIMDEDSLRRGMPTVHKHFERRLLKSHEERISEGRIFRKRSERFGISMAILQGDILYALMERCFTQSVFGAGPVRKALAVVHHAYRLMSEGQILDLLSELKRDGTERDYLRLIENKTARLFTAAVEVGAIFGGAAEKQIQALARFALRFGTAFQLQDDLLDIRPGLKGRACGSDIRRGKFTLLMIKALETASSTQRRRLLSVLGNDQAGSRAMRAAIKVLHDTGAVDDVKALALRTLGEARASLANAGLSDEARVFFEGLSHSLAEKMISDAASDAPPATGTRRERPAKQLPPPA